MKNSLPLHTYAVGSRVLAFSTTRRGGTGEGNYASFNINVYCGDTPENTAANRRLLAHAIGVDESRIIMPHQTHGINPRIIGSEFLALHNDIQKMLLEDVDSLMTDIPGICIGVSTADCVPLLLHDAEHDAVAAVHAGWRGTVKSVALRAVTEMRLAYGSRPEALRAVIGPAISQKNFEVGDEVYEAFLEAKMPVERIARREGKWHIDLPLCNRLQLMMAGVKEENIIMSDICTYDNADTYFSARRLGKDSGRIFTGILIR